MGLCEKAGNHLLLKRDHGYNRGTQEKKADV